MHITIVTETYPPEVNGVAMTLHRIASTLAASGHRVCVIRPRTRSGDVGSPRNSAPPDDGEISIEETAVPGLPLPGYQGLRFGLPCKGRLRRLWSAHRPDIVYVATEGPLGQSAIAAARSLEIAVTSGFHTNFHQYMEHYRLPLLKNAALRFLRWTHNRTLRTFAPSREVVARLTADGIRDVRLLGRGVDLDLFNPERRDEALRAEWGASPGTPVFLFVSRLALEKNIPLLIRAFGRVHQREPEARFVLVGDGPARAQLEASKLPLVFAGMRRGTDLSRHYASGDVFVFPSITETYGNVVPEAMASGLVTCAFDYAAPGQLIDSGHNGFLAPFKDEEAFLGMMSTALDERPNWAAIRRRARETTEPLTWKSIVRQFVSDLEACLPPSPGSAGFSE